MNKIKLLSLFSGIGSFEKGLNNLGIDYELVGFSEINKHSIDAYCAIHNINKNLNLGDVSKIETETIPDFDLMTYGFPCQDVSIVGKQEGFSKGTNTRSSLLWEAMNIAKIKKPKYMIAENVKNLTNNKFKNDFDKWINELNDLGYNTYYKIINAKDFIPQNRERIFVVSIRKDIDNGLFKFPTKVKYNKSVYAFLENDVNISYHLNEHFINNIKNTKYKRNNYVENTNKIINNEFSGSLIMDYRYDEGLRIRKNDLCPTLTTRGKQSVSGVPIIYEQDKQLRFITPLECWRLMGFYDEDFYRAKEVGITEPQLYKMAGNSIVVNVVEKILANLLVAQNEVNIEDILKYISA